MLGGSYFIYYRLSIIMAMLPDTAIVPYVR